MLLSLRLPTRVLATVVFFFALLLILPTPVKACEWVCVQNGGGGENCGCSDNPHIWRVDGASVTGATGAVDAVDWNQVNQAASEANWSPPPAEIVQQYTPPPTTATQPVPGAVTPATPTVGSDGVSWANQDEGTRQAFLAAYGDNAQKQWELERSHFLTTGQWGGAEDPAVREQFWAWRGTSEGDVVLAQSSSGSNNGSTTTTSTSIPSGFVNTNLTRHVYISGFGWVLPEKAAEFYPGQDCRVNGAGGLCCGNSCNNQETVSLSVWGTLQPTATTGSVSNCRAGDWGCIDREYAEQESRIATQGHTGQKDANGNWITTPNVTVQTLNTNGSVRLNSNGTSDIITFSQKDQIESVRGASAFVINETSNISTQRLALNAIQCSATDTECQTNLQRLKNELDQRESSLLSSCIRLGNGAKACEEATQTPQVQSSQNITTNLNNRLQSKDFISGFVERENALLNAHTQECSSGLLGLGNITCDLNVAVQTAMMSNFFNQNDLPDCKNNLDLCRYTVFTYFVQKVSTDYAAQYETRYDECLASGGNATECNRRADASAKFHLENTFFPGVYDRYVDINYTTQSTTTVKDGVVQETNLVNQPCTYSNASLCNEANRVAQTSRGDIQFTRALNNLLQQREEKIDAALKNYEQSCNPDSNVLRQAFCESAGQELDSLLDQYADTNYIMSTLEAQKIYCTNPTLCENVRQSAVAYRDQFNLQTRERLEAVQTKIDEYTQEQTEAIRIAREQERIQEKLTRDEARESTTNPITPRTPTQESITAFKQNCTTFGPLTRECSQEQSQLVVYYQNNCLENSSNASLCLGISDLLPRTSLAATQTNESTQAVAPQTTTVNTTPPPSPYQIQSTTNQLLRTPNGITIQRAQETYARSCYVQYGNPSMESACTQLGITLQRFSPNTAISPQDSLQSRNDTLQFFTQTANLAQSNQKLLNAQIAYDACERVNGRNCNLSQLSAELSEAKANQQSAENITMPTSCINNPTCSKAYEQAYDTIINEYANSLAVVEIYGENANGCDAYGGGTAEWVTCRNNVKDAQSTIAAAESMPLLADPSLRSEIMFNNLPQVAQNQLALEIAEAQRLAEQLYINCTNVSRCGGSYYGYDQQQYLTTLEARLNEREAAISEYFDQWVERDGRQTAKAFFGDDVANQMSDFVSNTILTYRDSLDAFEEYGASLKDLRETQQENPVIQASVNNGNSVFQCFSESVCLVFDPNNKNGTFLTFSELDQRYSLSEQEQERLKTQINATNDEEAQPIERYWFDSVLVKNTETNQYAITYCPPEENSCQTVSLSAETLLTRINALTLDGLTDEERDAIAQDPALSEQLSYAYPEEVRQFVELIPGAENLSDDELDLLVDVIVNNVNNPGETNISYGDFVDAENRRVAEKADGCDELYCIPYNVYQGLNSPQDIQNTVKGIFSVDFRGAALEFISDNIFENVNISNTIFNYAYNESISGSGPLQRTAPNTGSSTVNALISTGTVIDQVQTNLDKNSYEIIGGTALFIIAPPKELIYNPALLYAQAELHGEDIVSCDEAAAGVPCAELSVDSVAGLAASSLQTANQLTSAFTLTSSFLNAGTKLFTAGLYEGGSSLFEATAGEFFFDEIGEQAGEQIFTAAARQAGAGQGGQALAGFLGNFAADPLTPGGELDRYNDLRNGYQEISADSRPVRNSPPLEITPIQGTTPTLNLANTNQLSAPIDLVRNSYANIISNSTLPVPQISPQLTPQTLSQTLENSGATVRPLATDPHQFEIVNPNGLVIGQGVFDNLPVLNGSPTLTPTAVVTLSNPLTGTTTTGTVTFDPVQNPQTGTLEQILADSLSGGTGFTNANQAQNQIIDQAYGQLASAVLTNPGVTGTSQTPSIDPIVPTFTNDIADIDTAFETLLAEAGNNSPPIPDTNNTNSDSDSDSDSEYLPFSTPYTDGFQADGTPTSTEIFNKVRSNTLTLIYDKAFAIAIPAENWTSFREAFDQYIRTQDADTRNNLKNQMNSAVGSYIETQLTIDDLVLQIDLAFPPPNSSAPFGDIADVTPTSDTSSPPSNENAQRIDDFLTQVDEAFPNAETIPFSQFNSQVNANGLVVAGKPNSVNEVEVRDPVTKQVLATGEFIPADPTRGKEEGPQIILQWNDSAKTTQILSLTPQDQSATTELLADSTANAAEPEIAPFSTREDAFFGPINDALGELGIPTLGEMVPSTGPLGGSPLSRNNNPSGSVTPLDQLFLEDNPTLQRIDRIGAAIEPVIQSVASLIPPNPLRTPIAFAGYIIRVPIKTVRIATFPLRLPFYAAGWGYRQTRSLLAQATPSLSSTLTAAGDLVFGAPSLRSAAAEVITLLEQSGSTVAILPANYVLRYQENSGSVVRLTGTELNQMLAELRQGTRLEGSLPPVLQIALNQLDRSTEVRMLNATTPEELAQLILNSKVGLKGYRSTGSVLALVESLRDRARFASVQVTNNTLLAAQVRILQNSALFDPIEAKVALQQTYNQSSPNAARYQAIAAVVRGQLTPQEFTQQYGTRDNKIANANTQAQQAPIAVQTNERQTVNAPAAPAPSNPVSSQRWIPFMQSIPPANQQANALAQQLLGIRTLDALNPNTQIVIRNGLQVTTYSAAYIQNFIQQIDTQSSSPLNPADQIILQALEIAGKTNPVANAQNLQDLRNKISAAPPVVPGLRTQAQQESLLQALTAYEQGTRKFSELPTLLQETLSSLNQTTMGALANMATMQDAIEAFNQAQFYGPNGPVQLSGITMTEISTIIENIAFSPESTQTRQLLLEILGSEVALIPGTDITSEWVFIVERAAQYYQQRFITNVSRLQNPKAIDDYIASNFNQYLDTWNSYVTNKNRVTYQNLPAALQFFVQIRNQNLYSSLDAVNNRQEFLKVLANGVEIYTDNGIVDSKTLIENIRNRKLDNAQIAQVLNNISLILPSGRQLLGNLYSNNQFYNLQLREPTPITSARAAQVIQGNLRISASDYRGQRLTAQILAQSGLQPAFTVNLEGQEVLLSNTYDIGHGRIAVVAYIPDTNGRYNVRTYYRSNSAAIWRYLPGYTTKNDFIDWYGKGFGEESISLPIGLQVALAQINRQQTPLKVSNPDIIFAGTARNLNLDTEGTYVFVVDAEPRSIPNAVLGQPLQGKIPPESISVPDQKKPNFQNMIGTWENVSSQYGNITSEAFVSHDLSLIYVFNRDQHGRVWIAQIESAGSPITALGIRNEWISGEDLTTPAFEYTQQSSGYGNSNWTSGNYIDMSTNYLNKIPLIQEYRQERNVWQTTTNPKNQRSSPNQPIYGVAPPVILGGIAIGTVTGIPDVVMAVVDNTVKSIGESNFVPSGIRQIAIRLQPYTGAARTITNNINFVGQALFLNNTVPLQNVTRPIRESWKHISLAEVSVKAQNRFLNQQQSGISRVLSTPVRLAQKTITTAGTSLMWSSTVAKMFVYQPMTTIQRIFSGTYDMSQHFWDFAVRRGTVLIATPLGNTSLPQLNANQIATQLTYDEVAGAWKQTVDGQDVFYELKKIPLFRDNVGLRDKTLLGQGGVHGRGMELEVVDTDQPPLTSEEVAGESLAQIYQIRRQQELYAAKEKGPNALFLPTRPTFTVLSQAQNGEFIIIEVEKSVLNTLPNSQAQADFFTRLLTEKESGNGYTVYSVSPETFAQYQAAAQAGNITLRNPVSAATFNGRANEQTVQLFAQLDSAVILAPASTQPQIGSSSQNYGFGGGTLADIVTVQPTTNNSFYLTLSTGHTLKDGAQMVQEFNYLTQQVMTNLNLRNVTERIVRQRQTLSAENRDVSQEVLTAGQLNTLRTQLVQIRTQLNKRADASRENILNSIKDTINTTKREPTGVDALLSNTLTNITDPEAIINTLQKSGTPLLLENNTLNPQYQAYAADLKTIMLAYDFYRKNTLDIAVALGLGAEINQGQIQFIEALSAGKGTPIQAVDPNGQPGKTRTYDQLTNAILNAGMTPEEIIAARQAAQNGEGPYASLAAHSGNLLRSIMNQVGKLTYRQLVNGITDTPYISVLPTNTLSIFTGAHSGNDVGQNINITGTHMSTQSENSFGYILTLKTTPEAYTNEKEMVQNLNNVLQNPDRLYNAIQNQIAQWGADLGVEVQTPAFYSDELIIGGNDPVLDDLIQNVKKQITEKNINLTEPSVSDLQIIADATLNAIQQTIDPNITSESSDGKLGNEIACGNTSCYRVAHVLQQVLNNNGIPNRVITFGYTENQIDGSTRKRSHSAVVVLNESDVAQVIDIDIRSNGQTIFPLAEYKNLLETSSGEITLLGKENLGQKPDSSLDLSIEETLGTMADSERAQFEPPLGKANIVDILQNFWAQKRVDKPASLPDYRDITLEAKKQSFFKEMFPDETNIDVQAFLSPDQSYAILISMNKEKHWGQAFEQFYKRVAGSNKKITNETRNLLANKGYLLSQVESIYIYDIKRKRYVNLLEEIKNKVGSETELNFYVYGDGYIADKFSPVVLSSIEKNGFWGREYLVRNLFFDGINNPERLLYLIHEIGHLYIDAITSKDYAQRRNLAQKAGVHYFADEDMIQETDAWMGGITLLNELGINTSSLIPSDILDDLMLEGITTRLDMIP